MSPDLLDLVGHAAYVSLMGGTWLVGSGRWKLGWTCRAVGSAVWAWIGVELGMPSIWFWSGVFTLVDLRGFWIATRSPESRPRDTGQVP